jgi:hypothetical protein
MNRTLLLKLFLLFISLLFLYGLTNKEADVDDAWLGELAYWHTKLGYAKSELMRGITMQHIRHVCHHKLLTLQGGLFIDLFGFSLYTLKAVTLVYFVVFLLVFYFYTYRKIFPPIIFYCVGCLFLASSIVFDYAFIFRPEIPVMTLGFLSYIWLNKALEGSRRSNLFMALSGLFAGLCVSTHLNGVIFPMAGFLLLLWNRRWQQSLLFGIFTLPTIAIYFYDFTAEYNLSFWLYQMRESPAYHTESSGMMFLLKLLNEHKRFFHGAREIAFTLTFIFTFALAYRFLKPYKNLIRYTAILVVSLGLISVHKHTSKYMLLYFPYLFILMGLALQCIYNKELWEKYSFAKLPHRTLVLWVNVLLALYLAINLYYNIQASGKQLEPNENQHLVDTYIKGKTNTLNVVAPMTFIFNEIEKFNRIQAVLCYTEMQKTDKTILRHGFLQKTHQFDIDYIILSDKQIKQLGLEGFTEKDFAKSSYEVLENNGKLLVLKRLREKVFH